jgi:hypothetical protein
VHTGFTSARRPLRSVVVAFAALSGLVAQDRGATAGQNVHVLILIDNGVGSPGQAQPYVDKLMDVAKASNGWDAVEGKYVTKRKQAKAYIQEKQPQYGIFSLGSFLGMRKDNGLEVVGVAEVDAAGGRKFHLVSKSAKDLAGCKGQKVASNHFGQKKFLEKVVSGGAFTLKDFEVVKTKRPVQTLKAVVKDEAVCALVDNAQLAELAKLEGGAAVKPVWSSANLPPMAVVAFSGAGAAERARFKASLGSLCTGEGKAHCDKVGIKAIRPADVSAFASVVKQFGD